MKRGIRLLWTYLPVAGGELRLDAAATHHLLRVLRVGEGQELELLDGRGGRAKARLQSAGRLALLSCEPSEGVAPPEPELEAWLPLIKPERMEWAVEKLTELGVRRIVPFHSERTGNLRRPPDLARLGRLADAALEQSGNSWRPELANPCALGDLLEGGQPLFTAHPGGSTTFPVAPVRGPLALLAGPEGGFSPAETELVLKRSRALVSLGPHIVRAETAIVALTGVVQALRSWKL